MAVGAQVTKAVAQLPSKEAAPVNRRPLEAAQNQGWLWVDKMVAQLWKVPESPGEHLPTLRVQHPLKRPLGSKSGGLGGTTGLQRFLSFPR